MIWKLRITASWVFDSLRKTASPFWVYRSIHEHIMALARAWLAGGGIIDPLVRETEFLAGGIIDAVLLDRVNGATHYYAPRAMRPPGRVPDWATDHKPVARRRSSVLRGRVMRAVSHPLHFNETVGEPTQ